MSDPNPIVESLPGGRYPWDTLLDVSRYLATGGWNGLGELVGPLAWWLDRVAASAAADAYRMHAQDGLPMEYAVLLVSTDIEFVQARALAKALTPDTTSDDNPDFDDQSWVGPHEG